MTKPACNIVGVSSTGVKPLDCGCVEQLEYSAPVFGCDYGWDSARPPNIVKVCDACAYAKTVDSAVLEARKKAFQEHFGMSVDDIPARLDQLRNEKAKLDAEIDRLQRARRDFAK